METAMYWLCATSEFLELHNGAITAVATVVIAAFTVALAYSTKRLWRESKVASRISWRAAQAAKKSADGLALIERAYVFLESVDELNGGDTITTVRNQGGVQVSTVDLTVKFTFRNHGKTPAMLREIFGDPKLCKNSSEASGARGTPLAPGQVIGASDTKSFYTQKLSFDAADYKAAKETGSPKLFFFGVIHYVDVLKAPRYTQFCWRFDFNRGEFRPTLDPDLNRWD